MVQGILKLRRHRQNLVLPALAHILMVLLCALRIPRPHRLLLQTVLAVLLGWQRRLLLLRRVRPLLLRWLPGLGPRAEEVVVAGVQGHFMPPSHSLEPDKGKSGH